MAESIPELEVDTDHDQASVTIADKKYIYKYDGEKWILKAAWIRAKDIELDPNYIIRPDGIIDKER